MEFKNKTNESKRVRIEEGAGKNKGYKWLTIKTGDLVDIAENYGRNLGLTPTGKVDETDESEEEGTTFADELGAIAGIGAKTVEDILKVYPDKDSLLKAVQDNVELPFRNDVSQKLYGMFEVVDDAEEKPEDNTDETPEDDSDNSPDTADEKTEDAPNPDDAEENKEE